MEKINFENRNIPSEIENIMNESYNSFIERYGTKHAERIKSLLVEVSKNIRIAKDYDGTIAMAKRDGGIIYSKNKNLPAILKHELCHIYNNAYFDSKDETCFDYFPERYKEALEKQGNIIQEEYERSQKKYKENLKNNPEVFEQYYKKTYEQFRDKFSMTEDPEYEKWTEWFNTKINSKDMKNEFMDFEDGFYFKVLSSGSFYEYYTGISEMISNIVPEKGLLEMFINSEDYKTDMSYKDFIDNFDKTYLDALTEKEKEKYGYPYLKIIFDTNTIDKNAGKDNRTAREAYQSATTTCFKAYMQKINSLENCNEDQFKNMYDQIKDLQEAMIWNVDIEKMKDLEYVQVLEQIQNKFKEIGVELYNKSNNKEILEKIEGIDYKINNPFKMIDNGEKIVKEVFESKDTEKDQIFLCDKYSTKVSDKGIKGNLYASLKTLVGKEKYNLLFEKYQNENISILTNPEEENVLSKIFNEIEQLDTNSNKNILEVYNEIYDLYNKKMQEEIVIDENPGLNLKRYAEGIEDLKANALFSHKDKNFIPSLENVIGNYNEKTTEFKEFIKEVTEEKIEERANRGGGRTKEEIAEREWKDAEETINKIEINCNRVNNKENLLNIDASNKKHKYIMTQEDIQKEEEKYKGLVKGNFKKIDEEIIELQEEIRKTSRELGINAEIPNIARTVNNKLNDIAKQFKEAGISMYAEPNEELGFVEDNIVGSAIIDDMMNHIHGGVDKLKEYSKIENKLKNIKVEETKALKKIQTNPFIRFFAGIAATFTYKKLEERNNKIEHKKDDGRQKLQEYKDVDDAVWNYDLKDRLTPAIVNYMAGTDKKTGELDKYAEGYLEDALESINNTIDKLGYSDMKNNIKEQIIAQYDKNKRLRQEINKSKRREKMNLK